jgi:ABC-type uncharacterized transport system substrate-binding protein
MPGTPGNSAAITPRRSRPPFTRPVVPLRRLALLAALALFPGPAEGHPHEWIDVASEVLFDKRGAIEAIRHHWRFDEAFSAFALQGLDTDGDGSYSPEELKPSRTRTSNHSRNMSSSHLYQRATTRPGSGRLATTISSSTATA